MPLNNLAFATCSENGSPIGAQCSFDICAEGQRECITDVCVNGSCRECADDSDCSSNHCVDNICQ